jgi:hypothetical protein
VNDDPVVCYPPDCESLAARRDYLGYLYEALRREHNERGDLYEAGTMSESEWQAFLLDTHRPRRNALAVAEAALAASRCARNMALDDDAPELDIDLNAAFEPAEVG